MVNLKKVYAVVSLLAFINAGMTAGAFAQESSSVDSDSSEHVLVAEALAEVNSATSALTNSIKTYKANPDDATWSTVFNAFKAEVQAGHLSKAQFAPSGQSNSPLADLHAKLIETDSAQIWTFPDISQCHAVIVEWHESKTETVHVAHASHKTKASRKPKVVTTVSTHIQTVTLPDTAFVKDARIMDLVIKDKATAKTGRYLILAGGDRTSQVVYVSSYKWSGSDWVQDLQPLSQVPPLLLHNLHGTASFSGSDLIFNISPKAVAENQNDSTASEVATKIESSCYKLALRFLEDKFTLESKPGDDTPMAIVFQFVSAVQQGHMELAKGWLADPALVSIPRYIGLSSKSTVPTYRVIGMASTAAGNHRYRLVTFDKNDLIFEVGKVKSQWAIKSIFVAPANPLLQKIAKTLPAIDSGSTNQASAPMTQSMRGDADSAQIANKQATNEKKSGEAQAADDVTK